MTTVEQAARATQRLAKQQNEYWSQVYWLIDTTRRDWK